MARDGWTNVTPDNPCQICGKDHWCRVSVDGQVACCKRVSEGSFRAGNREGWLHRLVDRPLIRQPRVPRTPKKDVTDKEMYEQWEPQARRYQKGRQAEVDRLAVQLGVAKWTLDALMVGYGDIFRRPCWTFPQRNGNGWVVGISRRFMDGDKKSMPESRPALSYADDWADYPGPILIVEGGSDTAAGLTLHRAVVGRPSCTGGAGYLVRLLGKHTGRRIVVVAERDQKRHGNLKPKSRARHDPGCRCCMQCWPGKMGAMITRDRLRQGLCGRKVEWQFVPDGPKDLRGWLNAQAGNVEDVEAMKALGRKLFT